MSAQAQDASDWAAESHAAARLIAGALVKTPHSSFVLAGIEIRLDPGWKTYWRYPGDSGVPPTFNFAGSENVKSVSVRWPAPQQFSDGGDDQSLGYSGDVIMPLEVMPKDATRAASLHVALHYAICGNLCVPAAAELELTLTGKGTEEAALKKAELAVPKRMALGVADDGLAIRSVRREAAPGHDRVIVSVAAPDGAPVRLYVEGPTPEWALPIPQQIGPAAPERRFGFTLDGLPPGATAKNVTLIFTAISGATAIEVPAHLD
jgi:DsbC/DsbD-like thiol-disulfide interchange protein